MDHGNVFVGLDDHKDRVQVCVLNRQGRVLANRSCPNDWEAIQAVVGNWVPVQAGIEACCGAPDLADQLIGQAGWSIDLAHPGYVARMKQSPDKSDFSDARILADLERVGYLPKVWLAPESVRNLRRLVRYRQQLVDQRRESKLRITALVREHRLGPVPARSWTKQWLTWLKDHPRFSEDSRWIVDQHLQTIEDLAVKIKAVETVWIRQRPRIRS